MNHSHIESNVVKPHFIPTVFSTPSSNDWPFTVPPGGRSQRFHQVADHMTSLWPWRSGIVTNAVSIWKSFQGSKNDSEISKAVRISIYRIRDKWILWNLFGFHWISPLTIKIPTNLEPSYRASVASLCLLAQESIANAVRIVRRWCRQPRNSSTERREDNAMQSQEILEKSDLFSNHPAIFGTWPNLLSGERSAQEDCP